MNIGVDAITREQLEKVEVDLITLLDILFKEKIMGMLSDRMSGGDGFGEARKEGYAHGPYVAHMSPAQRAKAITEHVESGASTSEAMKEEYEKNTKSS